MEIKSLAEDLWYKIKFDILGMPLPDYDVSFLFKPIRIKGYKNKDGSTEFIEFPDYPGLYTTADNVVEMMDNMQDALVTYYSIPRFYAKRLPTIINKIEMDDGQIYKRTKDKLLNVTTGEELHYV